MSSHAWPHGPIKEIFPNIFLVTGTNITNYNNVQLQHSRNMVIVRDNNKLTLINTVRLDDKGLLALDTLGQVENIVKLGSFHGRDDAFYLDRYNAKLWALKGMEHENNKSVDYELTVNGQMPFSDCSLFVFENSAFPEGILHIARNDGIIVTCDSIKNWVKPDEFFSDETANMYATQDFFGAASISSIWLQACNVKHADFLPLKSLEFRHLISAHGEPLLNNAKELIIKNISAA